MKQKFFLGLSFLAMAGLWTGCSNDETIDTPVDGKAISFRVQGGAPTLRTTGTTPASVDAFIVWGVDDGTAGDLGLNANGSSIIFDAQTVARQQNGTFDYAPRKYFNAAATEADFYAYSPVYADVSSFAYAAGTDGTAGFSYTAPAPNSDGKTSQVDLLVAEKAVTVGTTSPQPISLVFSHALSRIFVTGQNSMSEDVTVTALELVNVLKTGEYDYETKAWTPTADTEAKYPYVLANTGVALKSGVLDRTLLTSMEQGMLIIPQKVANDGDDTNIPDTDATGEFALKVTYDIANLKNQVAYVLLEDEYEFLPNKQYAININFNPSAIANLIEITFTIDVDDWGTPIAYIPADVTLSFAYGNVLDGTLPNAITEAYDAEATTPGADFTVPTVPADVTDIKGALEWNTKADGTGTTINAGSKVFTMDTTLYLYDRQ